MKKALYFFSIIIIIHSSIQKLHAMEHDVENQSQLIDTSQKKNLKKSKINENKTPPLTWCVDIKDLESLPGEEPTTRKKNKKKKKNTSLAIHQQLQEADDNNNTMAALKLMNTIQTRQNKESRELIQLVSDNTGKQITNILVTMSDNSDKLQKQLAKDNTKKSIGVAIFTTLGVIAAALITTNAA